MYSTLIKYLGFFILLLASLNSAPLMGQEARDQLGYIEDGHREELNRYFGYEELLYRYITLPYDISQNVNQQGRFVEIGWVYLALGPIALLLVLYRRPKWFYTATICLSLYLLFCLSFSHIRDTRGQVYNPAADQEIAHERYMRIDGLLVDPIYRLGGVVSNPIRSFFDQFTGTRDHITYPLVILFILAILVFVNLFGKIRISRRVLLTILVLYASLWWLLGSGIVWYGLLILPIGGALMIKKIIYTTGVPDVHIATIRYLSISGLVLWMLLTSIARISNINLAFGKDYPSIGMQIVEPRIIPFSLGMVDADGSLDLLAPNLSSAIHRINETDGLILLCAAPITFDVKNNVERVVPDYHLSLFKEYADQDQSKPGLTNLLKSYGFRYIALDLNLYSIDHTPEQSLRKKFELLLFGFLRDNNNVRLVATDRIINESGTPTMGVYYTQTPSSMGSYAVWELL